MSQITKESFEAFVQKEFPGREYKWEYDNGHGYMYIQAGTGLKFSGSDVHYEYSNGQIKIHIEGGQWWWLRQNLFPLLSKHKELRGEVWQKRQNCQWIMDSDEDDIFDQFRKIRNVIENDILAYEEGKDVSINEDNNVDFEENTPIYEVFKKNLSIPPYQRIYAWKTEQVKTLLDDIVSLKENIDYHIGSIILHEHQNQEKDCENVNDVVDGQQRLVTLSLILYAIEEKSEDIQRFLKNRYESNEALLNIRDNMAFIRQYIKDKSKCNKLKANIDSLCFSVLTIKNTENLDLAFTFFSNTNSRGKKLTDYDLLKPHHLRFIPSELEEQQMHLATKWDSMISSQREKERHHSKEIDYKRLIEFCLYRLRKWSAWENEDLSVDHYIKKEFEAAAIIDELPPFGERFGYMEPIQGGQHFFAYIDFFLEKYKSFDFKNTIHDYFGFDGSCSWYGTVIEALIFCYYIRFGNSYINEAALSIIRYISVIRFNKGRAYEPTILSWALNSKIPILIERATSPTFFLAEMERKIENISDSEDATSGIRRTYFNMCRNLCNKLNEGTTVQLYSNYFKTRYEENGKICINSSASGK